MNNRENVLRALRRNNPESVPFDFVLCPSQIERFEKETGYTQPEDLNKEMRELKKRR